MPGFIIKTELFPLRFSLKDKSPLDLSIKIKNNNLVSKLLSLELHLPRVLSLDKSFLKKGIRQKLGEIRPNEEIEIRSNLYMNSLLAKEGLYEAKIVLIEHEKNYDSLNASYERSLNVRIVN